MVNVERRAWQRAARAGLVLAALSFTSSALAGDMAAAEALFKEGRRLMNEGQVAAACLKFAESQRLDPSSGTMLNLALCHEKEGKTATAWAEYLVAARLARAQNRSEQAAEAEQKAAAIEPRLSYLVVHVSGELDAVEGLEVLRGDAKLDKGAFGSRIPVDPGEYRITARAPGYVEWTGQVVVGPDGDSQSITVPPLERAPVSPQTPPPSKPAATTDATTSPASADTGTAPAAPTLAYVVGGLGVVATGVGAAYGLLALSAYHDAEAACPTGKECSAAAMDKRDQAGTRANIANVGIGLGLVGIGVGAVLLWTHGGASSNQNAVSSGLTISPQVGNSFGGASVTGRF